MEETIIKVKCIRIIKDSKGNIKRFVLAYLNGSTKEVTPSQLKQAIKNGKIEVVNLKLNTEKPKKLSEKEKFELYCKNAVALGRGRIIETKCGHHCYIINKSDTEHILYVPDDVTNCSGVCPNDIKGELNVRGCVNVTTMNRMFAFCEGLTNIYFDKINTSKVIDMQQMFEYCTNLNKIDLLKLDTSKVENMSRMFLKCVNLERINLRNFNTSNVKI